ncbi:inositol monophosphatase family protein [Marmoricola sp. RAF53]|uniref:inositol monophosphatase family protein n=1 Tax=Marmoricola sp. RAF53 TaxID=3233059 RepID=UPI003F9496D7
MTDPVTGADHDELLALALATAREAATLIAERRRAGVRVADTKTSHTDIVTEADRASEELIRSRVLRARPDDGILGEEQTETSGTSGVRWVVDPIDGTVNYLLGLPQYAVSIAVEVDGEAVVGVVVNAATGTEYTALRGRGAHVDGRPASVRAVVPPDRSVVATGFNYEPEVRALQAAAVAVLLTKVADVRRFGSCALDLCAVADGLLDGYVEEGCKPWDYAAGALIAREAGAVVETVAGASGRTLVVASPAASYPEFRDLVASCGFVAAGA